MTDAFQDSLQEKWDFPLRVFSVNVTKSAGNCAMIQALQTALSMAKHLVVAQCHWATTLYIQ